jgi:hypothetical protein
LTDTRLGARAASYTTEDIDIAQREALAFEQLPPASILAVVRDAGVEPLVAESERTRTSPYFRYLLEESRDAALIAREGCCAVRVPLPERYAIHKLLVSRLRWGGE